MNRIKQLREEFKITQQDLSDKLNCSKSVIGLYENETRKPSLEVLIKLSEIFNCSIDYLFCKTDIRKEINIDDADIAFANGVKGLNETNKMIIKSTLDALLAKQEQDNKEEK